jgi:release factor glutamine methyltransferase
LIPRPETEILVETIINSVIKDDKIKVLDIGAGSGNIAVTLAKYLCGSEITTIDNSESALETAKENANLHNVFNKIKFVKHDINSEEILQNGEFDIIVSNPPYISKDEFPMLKDELKIYEPEIALTDFSDGLSYFRTISDKSKMLLRNGGKIFFEVGYNQADDVKRILAENNFIGISVIKDFQKIDRVISGIKQ